MTFSHTFPVSGSSGITSYFDLVKPISIPGSAVATTIEPSTSGIFLDRDPNDVTPLPEHLQSFHGTGISDARLKQFNWLHPKNYSGDGSLSDEFTFSPYGTSVSSPRGDEWEIVEPGPRKNIDQLWEEVFEYQQRIKQLERSSQAQQLPHHQLVQSPEAMVDDNLPPFGVHSSYTSPLPMPNVGTTVAASIAPAAKRFCSSVATASATVALTFIDKSQAYASRKGYRSDRGSALRLLQSL